MTQRICFALLFLGASAWTQTASKGSVTLSVHLVVACPAGASKTVVKAQTTGGTICLDRQPFLTQDDVESAEIQPSPKGNPMVLLMFHAAAAQRELQITRKNMGKRVGIVLNAHVVGTPLISAASRLLYIDGNFTRLEAETVVGAFNRYVASRKSKL